MHSTEEQRPAEARIVITPFGDRGGCQFAVFDPERGECIETLEPVGPSWKVTFTDGLAVLTRLYPQRDKALDAVVARVIPLPGQ